jgi:hypothetical protein
MGLAQHGAVTGAALATGTARTGLCSLAPVGVTDAYKAPGYGQSARREWGPALWA